MTPKERQVNGALTPAAPAESGRPGAPRTIAAAVWLMYTGAGLAAVSLVFTLLSTSAMRAAVHTAKPHWAASRVDAYVNAQVTVSAIQVVIEIALWLLVAWACRSGRSWGRMLGTGLFILDTLLLSVVLVNVGIATALAMSALMWLVGLAAVILLWLRQSGDYLAPSG